MLIKRLTEHAEEFVLSKPLATNTNYSIAVSIMSMGTMQKLHCFLTYPRKLKNKLLAQRAHYTIFINPPPSLEAGYSEGYSLRITDLFHASHILFEVTKTYVVIVDFKANIDFPMHESEK